MTLPLPLDPSPAPRYIVTGAGGHLGNNLVRTLLDGGASVRALLLPGDKAAAQLDQRAETVFGDVCKSEDLDRLFDGLDRPVVIHAAGIVSIAPKNPFLAKVNIGGTRTVIDACRRHGAQRLIYVSSVHAIPEKPNGEIIAEIDDFDPAKVHGAYAKTKAAATRLVLDAARGGLDAVVVHPSGIVGPGDYGCAHMTQMLIDYGLGRLPAGIRGGYDFVDVRDVAAGIVAAAARGVRGECYILSNRYLSLGEMFSWLRRMTGLRRLRQLPLFLAKIAAPFFEFHARIRRSVPLFTRYSLYTLGTNAFFSHEKASRVLGYQPRPIEQTLSDTLAWLADEGRIAVGLPRISLKNA